MTLYVFPVRKGDLELFAIGRRVVVKHSDGHYVTGIVHDQEIGRATALVAIEIDAREL